jgi:choline transport protein
MLQLMVDLPVSCTNSWSLAHTMRSLLLALLRYVSVVFIDLLVPLHSSFPSTVCPRQQYADVLCSPQLASAIPSAGGIYHWASVTPGPKYGRILGFFAGSLNFFGWIFDLASIVEIVSNACVQMYAVFHPDFIIQPWHVYIAFLIITWAGCVVVIFFNRVIPYLQDVGLFLVIGGGLITIIVVAAMPQQHASNSFVWTDWENGTGWSSGVAFLTGVLNGAFTIGTPDAVTHMAEELPNPKRDLPRAVAAQIILGSISKFARIVP